MPKISLSTTERDANQLPTATAVTDAVEEIVETFETVGHAPTQNTGIDTVAMDVAALQDAESITAPRGPLKYQPLTRRELRALEAAEAARAKPTRLVFTSSSSSSSSSASASISDSTSDSGKSSRPVPETRAIRARLSVAKAPRRAANAAVRSATGPHASGPRATAPRTLGSRATGSLATGTQTSGIKRRIISKLATVGAMAGVGLIFISTTVPANAFVRSVDGQSSISYTLSNGETTQTLAMVSAPGTAVARDAYTVVSARQKASAVSTTKIYTFVGNPTGAIQWPFPEGSPISSGFGPRHVASCSACSTFHEGLDFTPGAGTPIHSVADGVVSLVDLGGTFGNHVVIDHVINGQTVQTVYAHMQYGSITVAMGQRVVAGQIIGEVGSTGISTGAHLHLEVHLGGVPVDPYIWLSANAK